MVKLFIYIILIVSNNDKTQINKVLDNLHIYASKADGTNYFKLFDSEAVFFGTDATERWHINEFKDYSLKRFETGTGWTYEPISRNIYINEILQDDNCNLDNNIIPHEILSNLDQSENNMKPKSTTEQEESH